MNHNLEDVIQVDGSEFCVGALYEHGEKKSLEVALVVTDKNLLFESAIFTIKSFCDETSSKDSSARSDSWPRKQRGKVEEGDMFFKSGEACRCVIRRCLRGGLIRYFVRDRYVSLHRFDLSGSRPVQELSVLCRLSAQGVKVARPLCAAIIFSPLGFFYRGIVVTEKVPNARDALTRVLADQMSAGETKEYSYETGRQARLMLEAGVMHRDLHPGNVLWSESSVETTLIDFDNARLLTSTSDAASYRRRVYDRWRRSCLKHCLPEELVTGFGMGLL